MKESRFRKPSESAGFLLWQVSAAWQRRVREELQLLGLAHAHFVLLAGIHWLRETGQPVTQIELGRATQTDAMTVSQALRVLEQRGLVLRQTHPSDARAKQLSISAEGRELLKEAFQLVETADESFFAPLRGGIGRFCNAVNRLIAERG